MSAPSDLSAPDASLSLRVALEVAETEAEGPGRRYALWLQGCPLRCAGCCNPDMLSFEGGRDVSVDEVAGRVLRAHRERGIEGLSVLGGEPFSQASALARLAVRLRSAELSIMVFTGHLLDELTDREPERGLLAHIDILVDGPYRQDLPDRTRRWIGSTNQRRHHLSARYRADDPRFLEPDGLELRLQGGRLTVVGEPAAAARFGGVLRSIRENQRPIRPGPV